MGLLSRMTTIIKARMNAFLERAEDPRETLDYSYERQLELLQNVRRGIVEIATSRKRLELQAEKLKESISKLDDQARQAMSSGREDLASAALQRKLLARQQLDGIQAQIDELQQEQDKLQAAESRLSLKIEAFRARKETIKAKYTAAEAQVKIGESVTGLSEEMASVGLALEHAEDKTQQMSARAAAIDELTQEGTLEDLTGTTDTLERELSQAQVAHQATMELEQLKKQMSEPKSEEPKEAA